jgi:hypothetical protein
MKSIIIEGREKLDKGKVITARKAREGLSEEFK